MNDTITARDRQRLTHATADAYATLYSAAHDELGSGVARIGNTVAIWNPRDDSAGYSCLLDFELADDPDQAWRDGLAAAQAGGARVFGVGITPERAAWASPQRRRALGLQFEYEETVWAARLAADSWPSSRPAHDAGFVIQHDGFDQQDFAVALNRGWELPDAHVRGALYASALGLPGWTHYLVRVGTAPAAVAVLCCVERVAACMVATTIPRFRGMGIQRALIARRLTDALAHGCDLATTETVELNSSPRNFERAGFTPLVRRQILRTWLE